MDTNLGIVWNIALCLVIDKRRKVRRWLESDAILLRRDLNTPKTKYSFHLTSILCDLGHFYPAFSYQNVEIQAVIDPLGLDVVPIKKFVPPKAPICNMVSNFGIVFREWRSLTFPPCFSTARSYDEE